MYKGRPIRLSADLSQGSLQASREWLDMYYNQQYSNWQGYQWQLIEGEIEIPQQTKVKGVHHF